jgi:hypothetical protein
VAGPPAGVAARQVRSAERALDTHNLSLDVFSTRAGHRLRESLWPAVDRTAMIARLARRQDLQSVRLQALLYWARRGATSIQQITHMSRDTRMSTRRMRWPDVGTRVASSHSGHAELRRIKKQGVVPSMKKASKQHLVLKRNTLKALTVLPDTAYRHVVGGAPRPTTLCTNTQVQSDSP